MCAYLTYTNNSQRLTHQLSEVELENQSEAMKKKHAKYVKNKRRVRVNLNNMHCVRFALCFYLWVHVYLQKQLISRDRKYHLNHWK